MDNHTYINILEDTLIQKNNILDHLIRLTMLQEELIMNPDFSLEQFDETLSAKEELIKKISFLDDGFDKIYNYIKDEVISNPIKQQEKIKKLQLLIKSITEKSAKLQTKELQNKTKLDIYLSNKKREIKNYKVNSQTVSNYYKNMGNYNPTESYFLDKKK